MPDGHSVLGTFERVVRLDRLRTAASHPLRLVRLIVSTIATACFAIVFLDLGRHLPASWISAIIGVQFAPAVLSVLTGAGAAIAVLVFLVVLTILFGRVYCSHLCPLGAYQDLFIWLRKGRLKHRQFPYTRPQFLLHYLITAATIVIAIGGSMWAVDLLEPYSNAGRILAVLIRPSLALGNNGLALVAKPLGGFGLIQLPIAPPDPWTVLAPVTFASIVGVMAYRSGRLFCNLLCPVGGVLSILSRRPAFAIVIKNAECIDCGLCQRVCRARCIDSVNRRIDTAACVGCFDCLESCPTQGMEFRWKREIGPAPVREDRRKVLTTLTAAVSVSVLPESEDERQRAFDAAQRKPVVPPGGHDIVRFSNLCTACHLCITACPPQVLQPSVLEYGWTGVFQPKMDYGVSYCTFDCVTCSEVCPTGALRPLSVDQKHTTQLGKAVFVKSDCIVETKKKDCGACAEHCPTKAVRMVPYEGKLAIPEVTNDYCVGCGACEHACPTVPRKAIYIDALASHQVAKVRPQERKEILKEVPADFPF